MTHPTYTAKGLRCTTAYMTKTIPWDSVRRVRYLSGEMATRHSLVLKPEHFPLSVTGTNLGGLHHHDVGRVLVVDELPDGRWIDCLVTETDDQRSEREQKYAAALTEAKLDHDAALRDLLPLVTEYRLNLFGFPGGSDAETAARSLALVNRARQLLSAIASSAQLVQDAEEK